MKFRRVGWLFGGSHFNLKDPNLRIKNFIHSNMNLLGWESLVISHPQQIFDLKCHAVVFCSVDDVTLDTIRKCKQAGIRTLFHHMESIFGLPFQKEIFTEVDTVICVSPSLAYQTESVHAFGRAIHIDDPADDIFFSRLNYPEKHDKPTVVYSGGSPYLAELYRPHVLAAGWDFKVLSYPNDGRDYFREEDDYGGNPYWWLPEYQKSHVALCAHDVKVGANKSVIKVITAWANGLVPIASPIPSYRAAIHHGLNGYIYHSFEDVTQILSKIEISTAVNSGWETVQSYRTSKIALRWMSLIDSLF